MCIRDRREAMRGLKEVDFLKKELGVHAFSAQYQQNPISMQSKFIDKVWIQRYSNLPNFNCIYQSWDTAIKIGVANGYSVCTSWGLSNNAYYLIDVFKKKLSYPDLKRKFIAKNAPTIHNAVDKGKFIVISWPRLLPITS